MHLIIILGGVQITDETIMANCFMFFLAGFENATGNSCAALLELADHPEVQDKLFNEIESTCVTDSGVLEITYEKLAEMKYLDMVVCGKKLIFLGQSLLKEKAYLLEEYS